MCPFFLIAHVQKCLADDNAFPRKLKLLYCSKMHIHILNQLCQLSSQLLADTHYYNNTCLKDMLSSLT